VLHPLIECPERLGTSGKVSNLIQMLRKARYEVVLINDSDIPCRAILTRVMGCFGDTDGKEDPRSAWSPRRIWE